MEMWQGHKIWMDVFDGERNGNNMLESHSHPYFELSFIIKGDITVLFDEKKYSANGNCVVLSPSHANHHILVQAGKYYRYNLYFFDSVLNALPGYEHKLNQIFKPDGNLVFLGEKAVERLSRIFNILADESEDEGRALLLALVVGVVFEGSDFDQKYNGQKEDYIDDVLRVIFREYGEKIIAEDLAARFFVSRTKLMTDFKAKIGKTLVEQITFVRVEQAKVALSEGNSVLDTALSCGFVNAANFTRVFKKSTGMTPKQYYLMQRNSNGQ